MTAEGARLDLLQPVAGVDVVRWNPRIAGATPRWFRQGRQGGRRDNFGDLLGPLIVERLATAGDPPPESAVRARGGARLLAVGSILHFAEDGDVVWGAGVNGKIDAGRYRWRTLDVRAVRGPLTERSLVESGLEVPPVFGDPAQLLPQLFPVVGHWAKRRERALTVVPNLNDVEQLRQHPSFLDPTSRLAACLRTIVQSDLVLGSSLHSVVVAEAFGVPARFVKSGTEHDFKYLDYLAATGRPDARLAGSLEEAERLGGYEPPHWDSAPLLAAFPHDLWDHGPQPTIQARDRTVTA